MADGTRAAGALARARGTFNGTAKFEGFDPNGARKSRWSGMDLLTVEDGKLVDNQAYTNGMQLGPPGRRHAAAGLRRRARRCSAPST